MLLSGAQIVLGPGTDMDFMGFNQFLGSSNDLFQPHVAVQVIDLGQSLGPYGLDPTGEDQNNVFCSTAAPMTSAWWATLPSNWWTTG